MDPTDPSPRDHKPSPTAHRLAELIRQRRDGILRSWESAVRVMPRARELDPPSLIDHIPDLLERIAEAVDELGRGRIPTQHRVAAERHAMSRLEEGFDLQQVIGELRLLRQCVFHALSDPMLGVVRLDELRALDDAVDAAVSASVEHYTQIRERTQHQLRDQARRASDQLAEQERQFRALADNIPQLAWMADAAGQLYWYNWRWYDYTGTTLEEMQGSGWHKVHHPDHIERVYQRWIRAVERGEPWEDTFPLRGADGFYRWFLSRAVPIRDGSGTIERWFGTNTDVTLRRFLDHATEALNRTLDERETLDQLARAAVPDIADWCVVDLLVHGELSHVAVAHDNAARRDAAWQYARTARTDPAGHDATWQIVRTGKPAMVANISDEMLAAAARDADQLRLLHELGFRSWIGAPLVARGTAIGVIHLCMNDSGRRYRASDLEIAVELGRRAGVAIDNARLYREAQTAVRVRDDLLAIVSHDLNNPLHAIDLGASLLLQHHGADARARKHIDAIRRSADRMERLINDLLDMASINAGKLAITPARVDACELVSEVIDSHEPFAHERGITITRDCDLGGVALHVDRDRIAQAFGNLLGNAIKFCVPGDVITVRAGRVNNAVRFDFADTGPGIAPPDLPHIFEPYWSGRGGRKKGTGLGLFITRAIIEAHGGTIVADSQPGAGASFVVTLPLVNIGIVSATTDQQAP